MKEKKTIAVITYHRANNYGAVLQAYATTALLQKYGYDSFLIDYYPSSLHDFGTFKGAMNEVSNSSRCILLRALYAIIKLPSYKKLKNRFSEFVNRELPITAPYYSNQELKNCMPRADYYCTGSDQVWNNYYTKQFEDAFFLDFVSEERKCFSLASSFGKTEFSDDESKYLLEHLQKYNFIFVREKTAVEWLRTHNFKNVDLMLDPTLLLEAEIWDRFASMPNIEEPYILVYQLHGDSDTYKRALEFGKTRKMKVIRIITMYHQIRPGSRNVVLPDIHEFLGLFKCASYVFTDSFHGTVFSHLFSRKLAITLPMRFADRILTFLSLVGTDAFILDNMHEWEKYAEEIDYNEINGKIEMITREKRQQLFEYIDSL